MPLTRRARFAVCAGRCGVAILLVLAVAQAAEPFHLVEWPSAMPKPHFQLQDASGRSRSERDYRGEVAIIVFGFTRCPDFCPSVLYKLALASRRLGSLADRVHVIFISLDPGRDSPEILRSYVAAFDSRFEGLAGDSVEVDAAARDFSVHYAKVPQGDGYTIDHSTGVYVLDKTSRFRLVGTLDTRVEDWVHDLSLLLSE